MKRSIIMTALLTATILTAPLSVYAATKPTPTVTIEITQAATAGSDQMNAGQPVQKVDYSLPYPGMLSDNPLYFLKQLRDKIMDMLISDPLRKADFYVLQSDKQLNAALFLNVKNKPNLTSAALSESSAFMDKAVKGINELKNQGKEVPGYVAERLQKSLTKHEEVLTDLVTQASDAQKSVFSGALNDIKKLESNVMKFK